MTDHNRSGPVSLEEAAKKISGMDIIKYECRKLQQMKERVSSGMIQIEDNCTQYKTRKSKPERSRLNFTGRTVKSTKSLKINAPSEKKSSVQERWPEQPSESRSRERSRSPKPDTACSPVSVTQKCSDDILSIDAEYRKQLKNSRTSKSHYVPSNNKSKTQSKPLPPRSTRATTVFAGRTRSQQVYHDKKQRRPASARHIQCMYPDQRVGTFRANALPAKLFNKTNTGRARSSRSKPMSRINLDTCRSAERQTESEINQIVGSKSIAADSEASKDANQDTTIDAYGDAYEDAFKDPCNEGGDSLQEPICEYQIGQSAIDQQTNAEAVTCNTDKVDHNIILIPTTPRELLSPQHDDPLNQPLVATSLSQSKQNQQSERFPESEKTHQSEHPTPRVPVSRKGPLNSNSMSEPNTCGNMRGTCNRGTNSARRYPPPSSPVKAAPKRSVCECCSDTMLSTDEGRLCESCNNKAFQLDTQKETGHQLLKYTESKRLKYEQSKRAKTLTQKLTYVSGVTRQKVPVVDGDDDGYDPDDMDEIEVEIRLYLQDPDGTGTIL